MTDLDIRPFGGDTSDPEDWRAQALCAQTDPEAFFPEKGESPRAAKKVCQACPVRLQCLQFAVDHNQRFGIWGGLSARERREYARAASDR